MNKVLFIIFAFSSCISLYIYKPSEWLKLFKLRSFIMVDNATLCKTSDIKYLQL